MVRNGSDSQQHLSCLRDLMADPWHLWSLGSMSVSFLIASTTICQALREQIAVQQLFPPLVVLRRLPVTSHVCPSRVACYMLWFHQDCRQETYSKARNRKCVASPPLLRLDTWLLRRFLGVDKIFLKSFKFLISDWDGLALERSWNTNANSMEASKSQKI